MSPLCQKAAVACQGGGWKELRVGSLLHFWLWNIQNWSSPKTAIKNVLTYAIEIKALRG